MQKPRDKVTATKWVQRFSGPNAQVWMHEKCREEIKDLGEARAPIEACMNKMYCQMENPNSIPKSKLNRNEGRHGARHLLVQAFKNKHGRVYGVEGSVRGKRAFFASLAGEKKKGKANPQDLERAAARVVDVVDSVPGASL